MTRSRKIITRILIVITSLVLFCFCWKIFVLVFDLPTYILPSPEQVFSKLVYLFTTGRIYPHLFRTLEEILWGFAIGIMLGTFLGYQIVKKHWLKITLTPYLIAFQSIPIVALAPLFIIWFGNGVVSKIIICSLVGFFPMLMNVSTGIQNVAFSYHELFRTYSATPSQILVKLETPSAIPYIFSGIKISIVLAIVGAIVGEFLGADQGLGFLVNASIGLFDTPLLHAVLVVIASIGVLFYLLAHYTEKIFTKQVYERTLL